MQGYPYYPKVALARRAVTSGASRNVTLFKRRLPIQMGFKGLLLYRPWRAGRSSNGRVVLRTRGKTSLHTRKPFINYHFRDSSYCFIAGFYLIPKSTKLVSLVFTASGAATYLTSSVNHKMFTLSQMRGLAQPSPIRRRPRRRFFGEAVNLLPLPAIFMSLI
jgi:hypothetical protein